MEAFRRLLERYGDAELLDRETLAARRRVLGAEHPDTIGSANNLAVDLSKTGQAAQAEVIDREFWIISRRTLGDNHLTTLTLANNLAYELGELDRLTEAEALLDQTIANAQQWRTQAVKPSVYITAMSRLGRLRLLLKRYPESYQAYGQAVLAVRQRYGDSRASGDADRALTEQNDQSGVFVGQVQAGWAWAHGSSN